MSESVPLGPKKFQFSAPLVLRAVCLKEDRSPVGKSAQLNFTVWGDSESTTIGAKTNAFDWFGHYNQIGFCQSTGLPDVTGEILFSGDVLLAPGGGLFFIHYELDEARFYVDSILNYQNRELIGKKGINFESSFPLNRKEAARFFRLGNLWEPIEVLEARKRIIRGED